MRKRIGIVGLGDIAGKVYLPLLSGREDTEIAGIMSRSEETVKRVGERYRIPESSRFTDLPQLLRQEPDAVFVHSPTETHFTHVKACLDAGVDVYVDKPISYDIGESEALAAAAEKAGRLLAVGFNRRFAPMYMAAKAWVQEAGGYDVAVAQKHRLRPQKHGAKQTVYDDLIHMIDLLLWLGGDRHEVASFVHRSDGEGRLLHATGTLAVGGSTALFTMARHAGADLEKLELHGGCRSAEVLNMETASFHDQHPDGPRQPSFGSWSTILERRGFAGAVDHFLACLGRPEDCTIRADLVLPTHHLVEKLPL